MLGWWDAKFKYWSVCVFFLYTVDFTLPSSFLVNFASKKGMLLFSSSSRVKMMLPVGSTVFMCCCNFFAFPVCTRQITSSTYRFQFLGWQSTGAVAIISAPGPPCTGSQQWGIPDCPWLLQTSAGKFILQI